MQYGFKEQYINDVEGREDVPRCDGFECPSSRSDSFRLTDLFACIFVPNFVSSVIGQLFVEIFLVSNC